MTEAELDDALNFLLEEAENVEKAEEEKAIEENEEIKIIEKKKFNEEIENENEEDTNENKNKKSEVPSVDLVGAIDRVENDINEQLDKLSNSFKKHEEEDNDDEFDLDELDLDFTGRLPTKSKQKN